MGASLFLSGVTAATFRPGFDVSRVSAAIAGGVVIEILRPDPNRISIALQSTGGTTINVSPISLDSGNTGFLLFDGRAPYVFNYSDYGPLVGELWEVISGGGPGRIMVTAVSWRGERG